jgi:uncharacterized membrane protein YhaH (DUF805 family)
MTKVDWQRSKAFFFDFQRGRIGRFQWWLFNLLFWPLAYLCDMVVEDEWYDVVWMKVLAVVALLVLDWTFLAVGAKRYHDLNRSGWRQALLLIPLIGTVWVFVELGFIRGTPGPNRFGYPGELADDD